MVPPSKRPQDVGNGVHKGLEIYTKTGAPPVPDIVIKYTITGPKHTKEYTESATAYVNAAAPHLPEPHPRLLSEFSFAFEPYPGAPIPFTGTIDLLDPAPGLTFGWDRESAAVTRPFLNDYKTTSDFRYNKTPRELHELPQAVAYGHFIFSPAGLTQIRQRVPAFNPGDEIDLQWLYLKTKLKTPKAVPVRTILNRRETAHEWKRIQDTIQQIVSVSRTGHTTADFLPPNPLACDKYGGCPYRPQCGFASAPEERIPTMQNGTGNILDDLRRAQAQVAAQRPPQAQPQGNPPPPQAIVPLATALSVVASALPPGVNAPPIALAPQAQAVPPTQPQAFPSGIPGSIIPPGVQAAAPPQAPPGAGEMMPVTACSMNPDGTGEMVIVVSPEYPQGIRAMFRGAHSASGRYFFDTATNPPARVILTADQFVFEIAKTPAGPAQGIVPPDAPPRAIMPPAAQPAPHQMQPGNAPPIQMPAQAQPGVNPAAPYGYKADGTPKKSAGGRKAKQEPIPMPGGPPLNAPQPQPQPQPLPMPQAQPDPRDNPPAWMIGDCVIFIDCAPLKSAPTMQPALFEDWIRPIAEAAAQAGNVPDWGMIPYTFNSVLAVIMAEWIKAQGLPPAIVIPSGARGANVAIEVLTPYARMIVRRI